MSRKSNRYKRRMEAERFQRELLEGDRRFLQGTIQMLNRQLRESKARECPDFVRSVILRCEQAKEPRSIYPTYGLQMTFQPEAIVRTMLMMSRGDMQNLTHELHYIADKIGRQAFETMLAALRKDGVLA